MCSIAIKKGSIASYGFNKYKTDPNPIMIASRQNVTTMYESSKDEYVSPHLHAEVAALKRSNTSVDTIVVIRLTFHGELAMAKPCNVCMAVMREYGVKTVIYSSDGDMKSLKIDE